MKSSEFKWSSLAYWKSGEWQVVRERLIYEKAHQRGYVPGRDLLFRSLHLVPFGKVRCVIMGQDPYPSPRYATGVAFSIPADLDQYPPTLVNLFKEYQSDLHYPAPKNGDLTPWCEQGVLLWNAYPSTMTGFPGKHHWCEWEILTQEILEKLDAERKGLVFIFLGRVARHFAQYIHSCADQSIHPTVPGTAPVLQCSHSIIETSHPSPLGANHGFLGSRIFSRANGELCRLGQPMINWRLPDERNNQASGIQ